MCSFSALASARTPSRSIITLRLKSARSTAANRTAEWSQRPLAGLAAGPVPAAQEHHVQVEHRRGQRDEVEDPRERDHPGAEVVELGGHRPALRCCRRSGPPVGEPSQSRKTGTAQKSAPRMNATVTFDDSSEATMPTAISIAPISQ